MSCDAQTLQNAAKCFECIPPGMRMSALIAAICQISTSGGGGGSGTVTTFSAGDLSPLFTSSVANPTTAPALSFALNTQTANTFFAGPTTGAAAAPTFRAMVNADLGTTLTPQFSRMGLGQASDANVTLRLTDTNSGSAAIRVDNTGGGDPYFALTNGAAEGGYMQYLVASRSLKFANFQNAGAMTFISPTGVLEVTGGFSVVGSPGVSGSFDATNTVTVTGGIITGIA